jgi:hypothetical protein
LKPEMSDFKAELSDSRHDITTSKQEGSIWRER